MARFIHHEPCPKCGSRDNLARYDDGGAFCFGCHYVEGRTGVPRHREISTKEYPSPPEDACHDFSPECVSWLEQYGVGVVEAIQRGLTFSPRRNQLIFNMDGIWQARNFTRTYKSSDGSMKTLPKCFTSGNVLDALPIYHSGEVNETIVIVEDPVSAIKVARTNDAMPVLGSHLANKKLERIAKLYKGIVVWLDSDKYKEAIDISERAKLLGLNSRVIHTELDPKYYQDNEIKEYLK